MAGYSRKIGNYIHYYYSHYLMAGTIPIQGAKNLIFDTQESIESYYAIILHTQIKNTQTHIKDTVKKDAAEKYKEEIENNLNYFFNKPKNNKKRQEQEQIKKIIQEKLDKEYGHVDIDWIMGTVKSEGNIFSLRDAVKSTFRLYYNGKGENKERQKKVHINRIMQYVNKAYELLDTLLDTCKKKEQLARQLNKVKEDIHKQIIAEVGKDFVWNESTELNTAAGKMINIDKFLQPTSKYKYKKESLCLLEEVERIIRSIKAQFDFSGQKGDLFEYIVALSQIFGNISLEEALKSRVADDAEQVTFNMNYFSGGIKWNELGFKETDKKGNEIIVKVPGKSEGTKGKIDVQIKIAGDNNFGASVKNYSFDKKTQKKIDVVHLVSKTSLLYLIQAEDPLWVNHMFNILAEHNYQGGVKPSNNIRNIARQSLIYTLFYKALVGGANERRSVADYFIINNNKGTGKNSYKVYLMDEILEKVANYKNVYDAIDIKSSKFTNFNDIAFKNDWVQGKNDIKPTSQRISKLLSDAHQNKLSISLKKTVIYDFDKKSFK